jgi:hypothetical protein
MTIQLVIGPFIQAGESLSDVADCRAGQPVRITMPAKWDGDALLTFQVSTDGKMFNDLYNHLGEEVTVKLVPYSGVIVPPDYLRSVNYLKIRSGTHDAPVEQTELREFAIAIEYG